MVLIKKVANSGKSEGNPLPLAPGSEIRDNRCGAQFYVSRGGLLLCFNFCFHYTGRRLLCQLQGEAFCATIGKKLKWRYADRSNHATCIVIGKL